LRFSLNMTRLNLDVWNVVLPMLDRRELWDVMSTSHSLWDLGLRPLLRLDEYPEDSLSLKWPSDSSRVLRFLRFVARDAPRRAGLLKCVGFFVDVMHLDEGPETAELISLLAYVLAHAKNVTELVVQGSLLEREPRISSALIEICTGVRRAHLLAHTRSEQDAVTNLVAAASWPLDRVMFSMNRVDSPGAFLASFSGSLRRVTMVATAMMGQGADAIARRGQLAHPELPHVEELQVEGCWDIDTDVLMRSFPNVKVLDATCFPKRHPESSWYLEGLQAARTLNVARDTHVERWQILQIVRGDTVTLYTLSIRQNIGFLILTVDVTDHEYIRKVKTVLDEMRPLVLDIELGSCEPAMLLLLHDAWSSLSRTRHLTISLDGRRPRDLDPLETVDFMVRIEI
jgi:hypothetical protein